MPQTTWSSLAETLERRGSAGLFGSVGGWRRPCILDAVSYQSLYRRFRPSRFAEVRGQDHITVALRNAVRTDTVGHAYMFSGPRGCGKTSSARILARALNCTNLADGEPCGVCDSCVAMESGTSMDLHELDAASNNGVDAMRDLVSRAALGTAGRNKVYILDEVHMLTGAASNALLKTLEEPPPHVTFVLATTDPQKVLPTIKSRTQHFNFELLSPHELENYVRWVIAEAELTVDDEAIAYVVRQGRGSARDTLSSLDQVVAGGGVVPREEPSANLVSALTERDTGAALTAVADALGMGSDPRVLAEALVADLRDLFLLTMGVEGANVADADREELTDRARRFGPARLTRALEQLGSALVDMRQASDPRVPLEVALVRLTAPTADLSIEALAERVEALERALAGGAVSVAHTTPPAARAAVEAASSATAASTPGSTTVPEAGPPPPAGGAVPATPPGTPAATAPATGGSGVPAAPAASAPATGGSTTPSPQPLPADPGGTSQAASPDTSSARASNAAAPSAPAADRPGVSGEGSHRSVVEEARAMLRAKTGKEAPPAEPIHVSTAEEPPPPPRRRRPKPPEGSPAAPVQQPSDAGPDPARPLVDQSQSSDAEAPPAPEQDRARPLVDQSPYSDAGATPAPEQDPARPLADPDAVGQAPVSRAPTQAPPSVPEGAAPQAPAPPSPAPPPAAPVTPVASAAGAERLNGLLDSVLGKLKPVTRALFVGHFDDEGGTLEFRLDNPAILDRAQARQGEFGEVLSGAAGQPVSFKLVAGSGAGAAGGVGAGRDASGRHGRTAHDGGPAPRGGDDSDEAEWASGGDYDDLADLEDADPPLSAAQRLIEAFPGAELITPEP